MRNVNPVSDDITTCNPDQFKQSFLKLDLQIQTQLAAQIIIWFLSVTFRVSSMKLLLLQTRISNLIQSMSNTQVKKGSHTISDMSALFLKHGDTAVSSVVNSCFGNKLNKHKLMETN